MRNPRLVFEMELKELWNAFSSSIIPRNLLMHRGRFFLGRPPQIEFEPSRIHRGTSWTHPIRPEKSDSHGLRVCSALEWAQPPRREQRLTATAGFYPARCRRTAQLD